LLLRIVNKDAYTLGPMEKVTLNIFQQQKQISNNLHYMNPKTVAKLSLK
jgi:hypothetical protein